MYRVLTAIAVLVLLWWAFLYLYNEKSSAPQQAVLPPIPENVAVDTPVISKEDLDYQEKMKEVEEAQLDERQKSVSDIELANIAISTTNPLQCKEIVSDTTRWICEERSQEALAIKEKNITFCDQISSESKKKICVDKIYYAQAIEKKDKIVCDMISDVKIRNQCTSQIEEYTYRNSQGQNSLSWAVKIDCDSYSNSWVVSQCRNDKSISDDYALLSQAMVDKQSSSCDAIRDQKIQNDCYDGVHFASAKNLLSSKECEKILNVSVKTQCITIVSTLSDAKYFQEALQWQNVNLCENIASVPLKTNCKDRIRLNNIILSKDSSDCTLLTDVSLQQVCKTTLWSNQ